MVSRQSAALRFVTQHAMAPEIGGKWETVYRNTKFLPTTLLCAECTRMKLKKRNNGCFTKQRTNYGTHKRVYLFYC